MDHLQNIATEKHLMRGVRSTSASIQLEHLINYGGLKKPTNINDGFDSSNDINPNMKTIPWNSARGWGNHLLDGHLLRGTYER